MLFDDMPSRLMLMPAASFSATISWLMLMPPFRRPLRQRCRFAERRLLVCFARLKPSAADAR